LSYRRSPREGHCAIRPIWVQARRRIRNLEFGIRNAARPPRLGVRCQGHQGIPLSSGFEQHFQQIRAWFA